MKPGDIVTGNGTKMHFDPTLHRGSEAHGAGANEPEAADGTLTG
jgi:hypothetical protein